MSRLQLTPAEMLALTQGWLYNDALRAILAAHAPLEVHVPRLQQCETKLLALDPNRGDDASELGRQAKELDGVHDFWVRAIVAMFEGLIAWYPENTTYPVLLKWLFPRGGDHATDSYLAEAGNGARVESSLHEHKSELEAIAFANTNMLKGVHSYVKAARALGTVEQQRSVPLAPAKVRDTRNEWLRVVKVLLDTAKFIGLSEAESSELFGALETASKARGNKKPVTVAPEANEVGEAGSGVVDGESGSTTNRAL